MKKLFGLIVFLLSLCVLMTFLPVSQLVAATAIKKDLTGVTIPKIPVCGNGRIEENEECDDGNTKDGDGCTPECRLACLPRGAVIKGACPATWTKENFFENYGADKVALDSEDNIYVITSSFNSKIIMYDHCGNYRWSEEIAGTSGVFKVPATEGGGITIDKDNFIYIVTQYQHPGAWPIPHRDVLVRKYDRCGEERWSQYFTTETDTLGNDIAVNNSGNVFITGATGGGVYGYYYFTEAYGASTGTPKGYPWPHIGFLEEKDGPMSNGSHIAVDDTGNVFVLRSDWDSSTHLGLRVIKYDSRTMEEDKDFLVIPEAISRGGRAFPESVGFALDRLRNIYVGGRTDTDSGAFIGSYDPYGNLRPINYKGLDNNVVVNDMAVDGSGNLYVVGQLISLPSCYNKPTEIFVRKYDMNGGIAWTNSEQLVCSAIYCSCAVEVEGKGIAVGSDGGIVAVGSQFLEGRGHKVWIRKYRPDGTYK